MERLNILIKKLKLIDSDRNKILSEIDNMLVEESIVYKGKAVKLNNNKGYNWSIIKNLQFSSSNYKVIAILEKDKHRDRRNFEDLQFVDSEYVNTSIGKKLNFLK